MRALKTLATTVEITAAARRLQAQGYPLHWQAAATGSPIPQLASPTAGRWAHRGHLDRLTSLARQLGEAMATPCADLSQHEIDTATRAAAALGYYPPAAYDEIGRLVDGAVVGHPWDRADELCTRRLEILDLLLTRPGLAHAEIGRLVNVSRRTVDRVSELIAPLRTDPAWVARAHAAVAAFRADEENPTTLALPLGIIDARRHAVAATHPAVLAMAAAA